MKTDRRKAIRKLGAGALTLTSFSVLNACGDGKPQNAEQGDSTAEEKTASLFFKISLAQWSLHKSFYGKATLEKGWRYLRKTLKESPGDLLQGNLNPMDFPSIAKNQFDIDAIELVNTFYFGKAEDKSFLTDFKQRCDDAGVRCLLIMCDAEGDLGNLDESERMKAVENHYKWVDAAKFLGGHSIRVNAAGKGTAEEVKSAAVDGLGKLTEYGAENQINIIVENHGGFSSDAKWLSSVIKQVNNPYCGTLPDFGNFCIEGSADGCVNEYDSYLGMEELMPFAKGVSAKSNGFDENGEEVRIDFTRMLRIVKASGFSGYIGIEYEGKGLSEPEGIKATKKLLEKAGSEVG